MCGFGGLIILGPLTPGRENTEALAESITTEQGKTLADARGDVFRGLEVVETTCNVAPSLMGETMGNLASGCRPHSLSPVGCNHSLSDTECGASACSRSASPWPFLP